MDDQTELFKDPLGVDSKQELHTIKNPLEWKAQKLQVQIDRMEKMAIKHPQQFSSSNYLTLLDDYLEALKEIDDANSNADDAEKVEDVSESRPEKVGERDSPGVGSGVSADNPTTG